MKFYLTAAIPYVNAKPHVGHALEFTQTDCVARYHKSLGKEVLLACGSDENALKNVQAAEKEGLSVEAFCARNADAFRAVFTNLHATVDAFQRSSSTEHHQSCQQLWNACVAAGDIYQKEYTGLYCVGCETFYTADELSSDKECFEHPGKPLVEVKEMNYFFRLSKYKQNILGLLQSGELEVFPESRKNETIAFLQGEVNDISISRSRDRARGWGVPVPNDPSQIMYVWFDALNVYQSAVGYGIDSARYERWWPADAHVIGKGISRFHTVYWIGMLLSAKLAIPKRIYIHGYFTVNGQKMSKTLGNVIDPNEVIEKFGAEAVRFYFLREFSTASDGDFSLDRLAEVYAAHLANGLGNLASRLAKLCSMELNWQSLSEPSSYKTDIHGMMERFELKSALDAVWTAVDGLNKRMTDERPWELAETDRSQKLREYAEALLQIAYEIQPFLPETGKRLLNHFTQSTIQPLQPLFPRLLS